MESVAAVICRVSPQRWVRLTPITVSYSCFATFRFWARNTSMSMCSSVSHALLVLQMSPDVLNTRSEAELEAEMHRCFLANWARWRKVVSCVLHHVSGASSALISGIFSYTENSFLSCISALSPSPLDDEVDGEVLLKCFFVCWSIISGDTSHVWHVQLPCILYYLFQCFPQAFCCVLSVEPNTAQTPALHVPGFSDKLQSYCHERGIGPACPQISGAWKKVFPSKMVHDFFFRFII